MNGFLGRSLRSVPEIRSSLYAAQMHAPLNREYLRSAKRRRTKSTKSFGTITSFRFKRGQNRPQESRVQEYSTIADAKNDLYTTQYQIRAVNIIYYPPILLSTPPG